MRIQNYPKEYNCMAIEKKKKQVSLGWNHVRHERCLISQEEKEQLKVI